MKASRRRTGSGVRQAIDPTDTDECGVARWSRFTRSTEESCAMSDTFDVVVSRILPVPPEQAWHAWSEADLVKRWWGPTGFSCPSADVDLRVGGRTLVAMRAPAELGGGDMYGT